MIRTLSPWLIYSPGAAAALATDDPAWDEKLVRLRQGAADLASFERHVHELMPGIPIVFTERRQAEARASRAVRPYVLALVLFALLAAIAASAVIGQLVGRQARLDVRERPALAAMGFNRRNFATVGALQGAFVGLVGGAFAVVGAVLASHLMPIGPMRAIEPDPGFSIDWTVLGFGLAVIVLLIAVRAAFAAARMPKRAERTRPARVTDALARTGTPTAVVSGVRLATDGGRGTNAVPVRSTMLGIGIALVAIVSTLVYAAGLVHFTGTPRLYGWNWSAQVDHIDDSQLAGVRDALHRSPSVGSAVNAAYTQLDLRGKSVPALGIDPPISFTIADGRAPRRDDEVVLGAATMRAGGTRVGRQVAFKGPVGVRTYHVVGRAVFPRFAPYPAAEPTGLGVGAGFTLQGLRRANGPPNNSFFLVTFAKSGTGRTASAATLSRQLFHGDPLGGTVYGPQRPNDVTSYDRLTRTPLVLALPAGAPRVRCRGARADHLGASPSWRPGGVEDVGLHPSAGIDRGVRAGHHA